MPSRRYGTRKTLQVISFLEKMYEKKKDGHVLLIVPASLLGNWSKEIDRFAPKMPYYILHGKTILYMKTHLSL